MRKKAETKTPAAKPVKESKTASNNTPKKLAAAATEARFPIVGIGASAGGLEALEQFLSHVPDNSGLAYVIIQHLDPTHKGIMTELLQRSTGMKVFQVTDRTKVYPDCVYVIPPGKDMSLMRGMLHLFEPSESRGLRLPIDFFLRSLADDCAERSIGVILSGMGSDGTLGLRAIKEKAGLVLVQEPASAKFDSMPNSAIRAGLADLVAPAEELPGMILAYLRHAPLIAMPTPRLEDKEQSSLEKIAILLRTKTGHDFSLYKKSTIYRRIERRMGLHQISSIVDYVRYLQQNSQELDLLFKELLIGVTNFFRDPDAWEVLKREGIPTLLAKQTEGQVLRAWSAGCSTGEEAYSLAIVFREAQEQLNLRGNFKLQIFATDLDPEGVEKARQGVYPANIAADVSAERLKRFFIKDENGFRVSREIREMVTFATQNIIMDPPFTKLDILVCRNLLIYFAPELQKKLLPLFHYSLNPGGILFLGSAETTGVNNDMFLPLSSKQRLFHRSEIFQASDELTFPTAFVTPRSGAPKESSMIKATANLQSLADSVILQRFSPPTVLTNDKGDILYFSGRTAKYLEPPTGKANLNVHAMAREGLRYELGSALQKATRSKNPIVVRNLTVGSNEGAQTIDLTVQMLEEPAELRGMIMIVFTDVPTPPVRKASGRAKSSADNAAMQDLEKESQRSREELQNTREEMQTSQEELRASNEELQSVNEELQSTNEELSTSKEEMQSLNEELQSINAEQTAKVDELSRLNNDMKNLLNSTEIATVFLDSKFCVRRFTSGANKLFKLIPGDVGRPLSDIVNSLCYPDLPQDVEEVLRTLVFSEKQIKAGDDSWFQVRIMPYRTLNDIIDGVVLTFMNITASKTLEKNLLMKIAKLESQLDNITKTRQ